MAGRLEGKVAFVTGAGGDLAGATASLFAAEGAAVVVHDVNEAAAKARVDAIVGAGGRAIAQVDDITDSAAVENAFDAATAEFTSHGIAGARIDRIAHAAGVNKERIYAYFGNKRQLFETVVGEHVTRFLTEVPFDAHDLPAYAAASFDFFTAHPEIVHLGAWHALEPGET